MVKQIFAFLRWQFARFKWHDYVWFLGSGMIGAGWETKGALFYSGVFMLLCLAFGAMVKSQWRSWKEERKELFETIKDSK